MTLNGWLQILFYFFLVLIATKPMGSYMTRVFERRKTLLDPVLVPVERAALSRDRHQRRRRDALDRVPGRRAALQRGHAAAHLLVERVQYYLPWNPQHLTGVAPGLGVEHRDLLHDEHQLAGLHARNHDELFHRDGWAGDTQLLVRRRRTRACHRVHSRHRAPRDEDARQLLGRSHPRHPSGCCCRSLLSSLSCSRLAGRRSRTSGRTTPPSWWSRRRTTAPGPDGKPVTTVITTQTIAQGPVASQEAIKMLGTNGGGFFNANSAHPFENPTPFTNLIEMLSILLIPAGLTVTLGQMTQLAEAWLGGLRRDGGSLVRRRSHLLLGGGASEPAAATVWTNPSPHSRAAATWRARRFASASPTPRSSRTPPPTPAAAQSTPCTTPSCRSAAWSRWSTSCSARSSSAAWARACTAC